MKIKSVYIKLLISAAFILIVCFKIDWSAFGGMLGQIDLLYLIISFAISISMIGISCLKWWLLLRLQGKSAGFLFLLKNYYIGYFFSLLLPSNIGGDVTRSYYVGKRVGDQYTSAVSVFIERFSGVIFLLMLVVAAPWIRPDIVFTWRILLPMFAAIFIMLIIFFAMVNEALPAKLNKIVLKILQTFTAVCDRIGSTFCVRFFNRAREFYTNAYIKSEKFNRKLRDTVALFKHHVTCLILVIAISVLFYIMTWFNVYISFKAFNINVPFLDVAALVPTILFVAMIPISLGSIGLAEGAYIFYFAMVGVTRESALIMSLLIRFKITLAALTGFFFYITYKHRRRDYDIMSQTSIEKPQEKNGV
jgi:glycosyltransferase 2 family protein